MQPRPSPANIASAAVNGTLNVGSAGTVTISAAGVTFNPDPSAYSQASNIVAEVGVGTSLTYSGCSSGTLAAAGTVNGCLFVTEGLIMTPTSLTAATPPQNPLFAFAQTNNLTFSLTGYGAGSSNTNCTGLGVGDSCSFVAGSPLIFTRTATGSEMTIGLVGSAFDGSGDISSILGQFSAPIASMTPAQLDAFLCPGGVCDPDNAITASSAGNFVVIATNQQNEPTPEPASWMLMIFGFAGLAFVRRARTRASHA